MREVALDTETTGLDPESGDRIVEIGCVELHDRVPTGREWRALINPERDMPAEAYHVHGLSEEVLRAHPPFAALADDFLAFIGEDDPLVIHNAAFDLGFLNAELARAQRPTIDVGRAVDTLDIARRKFAGAPASLDALCRRFGIDISERQKHGALLDAKLLAEVYLELVGGRQPGLGLAPRVASVAAALRRPPRPHAPSAAELAAHAAFVATLSDPIWAA
jgi:DNA polymerase-3 subunit epsilon